MYLAIVILLMVVLPVGSILTEWASAPIATPLMLLVGKWFVFWSAGVRLLLAGIKQFFQPQFHLLDIGVPFLRTRTEVHAFELDDEQLQTLDLGLFGQQERLQRRHVERVEIGQLLVALRLAARRVHTATMSSQLVEKMKMYQHFCEEMF